MKNGLQQQATRKPGFGSLLIGSASWRMKCSFLQGVRLLKSRPACSCGTLLVSVKQLRANCIRLIKTEQMETTYKSKIDIGLMFPIFIIIFGVGVFIAFLSVWIGLVIISLLLTFIIHMILTTYYIID